MGQGGIKGVKKGVRLRRVSGGGGCTLAVPSERRRGMLDGHIQSGERGRKGAAVIETESKSNI